MGPKKSGSDFSNESGYPGVLYKLCKEEDVLIIPQFVTQLVGRQTERVSPKKSKDSKLSERFGSSSIFNDSRGEDLFICGNAHCPRISVIYENPDDKETPVAIICKNFYLEFSLINAIGKSLIPYPTIATLKIENCCIGKDIVEALALLLTEEPGNRISDLSLDGNEGLAQVLPLFVKLSTGVRYLSLQRCSLNDQALKTFAEALSFSDAKDHQLQVLNLSMNKIENAGVSYLAEALRTNRSLISLSLAGNQIGDEGVERLTEVLQKFRLTYAELVLRRHRIFETIFKKKAAVERHMEEWKTRGEMEAFKITEKNSERTGRKIRGLDGKVRCVSSKDRRSKPGTAKINSGEKFRGKTRNDSSEGLAGAEPTASEISALVQQVESEMPPDKHPLVNEVIATEDAAWCAGCWSLGSINLAYNYLSENSLKKFTEVFYSQTESLPPKVGLLRLVLLPGNLFQETFAEFQKLQSAMIYRNSRKDVPENTEITPVGSLASGRRMSATGKWNKNR